jgi:hypothetical protein
MKKLLIILASLLILAAIPVTMFLVKQNQDNRSKAAPATVLTFSPSNLTKQVGDEFNIQAQIDTGANQVFVAEIHVSYDPTKLEAVTITNGPLFPNVLIAGKIDPSGKVSITLGAANQTTPVTGTGTAAIIKFKALASTSGAINVQFTKPDTFVGASGEGATNVLVSSQNAAVTINKSTVADLASNMTTITSPTPTLATISSPTPTRSQTSVSPTPTPTIIKAQLTLTPTPTTSISTQSAIINPTPTAIAYTVTVNVDTNNSETQPIISGNAPPNSRVTITIHSTPRTITVTSDANGNWTYTPTSPLESGSHTINVSAVNPNGGVLSANTTLSVSARSDSAAGSAVPVTGNIPTSIILVVLISIGMIVTGIILPLSTR